MAVKKITWQALMENLASDDLWDMFEDTVEDIDDKLNEYLHEGFDLTPLKDLYGYVKDYILCEGNQNIWRHLPIYISSYKETDRRGILLYQNKLREYLAFYKKILDDEGLQRHLVYAKSYSNDGTSDNTERSFNSVTPQNSALYDANEQTANTKFDQAIADYASAIDKNKSKTTSHTGGTSDTTVSGTTWEEAKKNIQYIFFNELKDYVESLPERIYHWYSLDTIPAPELCKKFFEYLHEVAEMMKDE